MDVISTIPGVDRCAGILRVLACLYVPGMVWGWLALSCPFPWPARCERYLVVAASTASLSLAVGICLTLARWYTVMGSVMSADQLSAIVVGVGLLAGLVWRRADFFAWVRASFPGGILMAAVIGGILAMPHRGEWIAGGLDPGLYINQGILHAREGAIAIPAGRAYVTMDSAHLAAASRDFGQGYVEIMPGVAIDPATRTMRPAMNPAWPALIGQLWNAAGVSAACRAGNFAAVVALLLVAATMAALGLGWGAVSLTALALILQPLFWYHAHVPLPEMLEFAIIGGILLMRFEARLSVSFRIFMSAALMLVGVMNRISFAPLGALCLLVFTWADRECAADRTTALGALLGIAALCAGVTIDLRIAAANARLDHIWPVLWIVTMVGCGLTMMLLMVQGRLTGFVSNLFDRWIPWLIVGACLIVTGWAGGAGRVPLVANITAMIPFTGACAVVLLCVAVFWMIRPRSSNRNETVIRYLVAAMSGMIMLLLMNKWVADIYPWATRRYFLPFMLLYALAAGSSATVVKHRLSRWAASAVVALVVACIAVNNLPLCRRAFQAVEYDGLAGYVNALAGMVGRDRAAVVIVDDVRLATPLRCVTGCDVFDVGFLTYARADIRRPVLDAVFQALEQRGITIWIAAAHPETVALIESETGRVARNRPGPPRYDAATVIHGPHVADFVLRTRTLRVSIYECIR